MGLDAFENWLISQGAYICLDVCEADGKVAAKLDGRGWFAPQWVEVPSELREYAMDLARSLALSRAVQEIAALSHIMR